MLNIQEWIEQFQKEILLNFKERICFIGLQGSYARGEATENSDIDVVVIFDTLTVDDLKQYDQIISQMSYREKICGFLSGRDEIICWEKSDLFQFYYDTKPIYKNLDFILPFIKQENIKQAILIGSCNIYHTCCHNMIHEKSMTILKALYKQSIFVLQAKYFLNTHQYIHKKKELIDKLDLEDKKIINLYFNIQLEEKIMNDNFDNYSNQLFIWSSQLIKKYN